MTDQQHDFKIVEPEEYLRARSTDGETLATPGNIRTMKNSSATCVLSLDDSKGFYIWSDGSVRGEFFEGPWDLLKSWVDMVKGDVVNQIMQRRCAGQASAS